MYHGLELAHELLAERVARAQPIAIPSLHLWGDRDQLGPGASRAVAEFFAADQRELVIWPGAHVVPTSGEGADAIVRFVARQAGAGRAEGAKS